MNLFSQHRLLSLALGISLLAHGVLLAVHFVAPDAFRLKPSDPELEVILVNARHDKKPVNAEALAQANLDGGGNVDQGRAKSPLPDMKREQTGDSVKAAQRRVAELEEQQRKMLAQAQASRERVASAEEKKLQETSQSRARDTADAKAIALKEAELAKQLEAYNKRPKKTEITPNTREVGYAQYFKTLQDKIEKVGTLNFPSRNGKKLYGELLVVIPVFQDGSIYERDGGVVVVTSSGDAELDRAAIAIVRRSVPFGRFPDSMRTSGKDDVWEVIMRFNFTGDKGLQTQIGAG